jgi:tetratricopeptide (TPR) repeat protein
MPPHVLRSLHELLIELFTPEDLKILLQRDVHDAALINGRAIVRSLPEQVSAERFVWLLIEELERRGHLADAAQLDHLFEALRRARPYRSQWLDEVFALVRAQIGRDIAEPPRFARRDLKWSHVFRPALMDELRQRLERTGFVSVIGPPGIGKTEICAEYVHTQRQGPLVGADAPPPTLWIDASAVQTRSDLVVALSQSVRLPNAHDITVDKHAQYLLQHLQAQYPGLLIVLDGVQETLTPDALALLERLNGLGIGLLLSAQMATAALCEQILDAPNLTVPEATALLETLYQHLQPALTVGGLREADRAQLARVSEALMGHPGCLIQAGNHFGTVSPRDMLPRVKRYKGLIDGALEHVWRDELSEDERTFALLLASSSCGLLLSDLEDCLGESPERDTLDVLLELRRRSWVRPTLLSRGQGTYYRYELMSAARPLVERLVGAEPFALAQTRAREALVRRAKALAVGLHRRGWEEALDELDLRVPDLKILLKELIQSDINAAAELMLALDRVLVVRGLVFEHLDLYNLVMAGGIERVDEDLTAWLYLGRAMVFNRRRDREMCMVDIEQARRVAERPGVPLKTLARVRIGWIELTGRYVGFSAIEGEIDDVRDLVSRSGDAGLMMSFRYILSSMEILSGRMSHAESELLEVLEYRRKDGDSIRETYVTDHLIMLARLRGQFKVALEYVDARIKTEQVIGRRGRQVELDWSRGALLFELLEDEEALSSIGSAYQAAVDIRSVRWQGYCLLLRALIRQCRGDSTRAQRDYLEAIHLYDSAGLESQRISAASYYLLWCAQESQHEEAVELELSALNGLTERHVEPMVEAFLYDAMMVRRILIDDFSGAVVWAKKSGDLYKSMSRFTATHIYNQIATHLTGLHNKAKTSIELDPTLYTIPVERGASERTRLSALIDKIINKSI